MNVLIADDQEAVRSALRLFLEHELSPAIILETDEAHDLLDSAREDQPHVILLDWELPGYQNTDLLMLIRQYCPQTKVIVLSGRIEAQKEALQAGVDFFISKSHPSDRLLETLRSLIQ